MALSPTLGCLFKFAAAGTSPLLPSPTSPPCETGGARTGGEGADEEGREKGKSARVVSLASLADVFSSCTATVPSGSELLLAVDDALDAAHMGMGMGMGGMGVSVVGAHHVLMDAEEIFSGLGGESGASMMLEGGGSGSGLDTLCLLQAWDSEHMKLGNFFMGDGAVTYVECEQKEAVPTSSTGSPPFHAATNNNNAVNTTNSAAATSTNKKKSKDGKKARRTVCLDGDSGASPAASSPLSVAAHHDLHAAGASSKTMANSLGGTGSLPLGATTKKSAAPAFPTLAGYNSPMSHASPLSAAATFSDGAATPPPRVSRKRTAAAACLERSAKREAEDGTDWKGLSLALRALSGSSSSSSSSTSSSNLNDSTSSPALACDAPAATKLAAPAPLPVQEPAHSQVPTDAGVVLSPTVAVMAPGAPESQEEETATLDLVWCPRSGEEQEEEECEEALGDDYDEHGMIKTEAGDENDNDEDDDGSPRVYSVTLENGRTVTIPEAVFAVGLTEFNRYIAQISSVRADKEAMKKLRRQYQGRISSRTARAKRRRQQAALKSSLETSRQRAVEDMIGVLRDQARSVLAGHIPTDLLHAFLQRTEAAMLASRRNV